MIERFDRVEAKMDKLGARLSLLEESFSVMRAIIGRIDSWLNEQILMASKVNSLSYRYISVNFVLLFLNNYGQTCGIMPVITPLNTYYGLVILPFHHWYNAVILSIESLNCHCLNCKVHTLQYSYYCRYITII